MQWGSVCFKPNAVWPGFKPKTKSTCIWVASGFIPVASPWISFAITVIMVSVILQHSAFYLLFIQPWEGCDIACESRCISGDGRKYVCVCLVWWCPGIEYSKTEFCSYFHTNLLWTFYLHLTIFLLIGLKARFKVNSMYKYKELTWYNYNNILNNEMHST